MPLNFNIASQQIHGLSAFDYSEVEYINLSTKVILICMACHKKFKISPIFHLYGKQRGCDYCAMHSMERTIYDHLKALDIRFFTDYWFSDDATQHYDFYLSDYNAVIEYDNIERLNKEPALIKTNYCKKNKVSLLRIHYIDEPYIVQGINIFQEKLKKKKYTRIFSRPEEYKCLKELANISLN